MNDSTATNLRRIRVGATEFTLLGTAHVSRQSAEDVRRLIESEAFDAVAVELCPGRHAHLTDPDKLANLDLMQVLREGKAGMVAANLALGAYQQRLAEQFGIEPGAEMKAAIEAAAAADLPLWVIDREIGTTLKRVYRRVGFWQRMMLLSGIGASLFSREEVREEEIERLKEGDILEATFSEFAQRSPVLYETLIDERDRYMAARLLEEHGEHARVLVVIGAGHLKGIASYLENLGAEPSAEIARLDTVPPAARWPKLVPWLIVALILVGFGVGFAQSEALGWRLVLDWVLINGGLSALGALLAAAHPLSVVTAFVAAPLTSLNPTIGAGFVVAGVEIWLRKPRVGDFSRLRQDVAQLKGWWRNRVARTLLVFILASLGSAVGTYLAGFRIFAQVT